jgi:PAS domain S-box-containing protein
MKNDKKKLTKGQVVQSAYRPQFKDAKEAIKETLFKQKGSLELPKNPKIAIEVIDDEIQKHKPIEQALVAEHLFRKAIEDSIAVGIAGFDVHWNQIYVNQIFSDMVGWPPHQLIGVRFPQPYWPPFNNVKNIQELKKKIENSDNFEIQFHSKDKNQFWCLVHSNVLIDTSGESVGRLISVANINNQKKAEIALKDLSTRLIGSQEHERKHIAQELHDSIGGRLTGIKYAMERIISEHTAKNSPYGGALHKIVEAIRSAIEETQRITKKLHPSILDDLGLKAAARGYCKEFGQFCPDINVDLQMDLDEKEIPENLKILVYRVLQESLSNVAKHSHAGNVKVSLSNTSQFINLVVEDDGKGFDTNSLPVLTDFSRGLGIDGMRERAELFGGKFSLESHIDLGVKIHVNWPIKL